MKLLVLLALAVSGLFAQPYSANNVIYTAHKDTTLSGAAEVVTIRVPSGTNKSAFLIDAALYCSVACTVTLEIQGTYSSGTTITPTKSNSNHAASEILATYSTSIASTTTVAKYTLSAGEKLPLDMRGYVLNTAEDAITFRTSSITGVANILVRWEQK